MLATLATTPQLSNPRPLTERMVAREATDLYEFRRVNYADGWDGDDADLGWVDEEIVKRPRRRAAH